MAHQTLPKLSLISLLLLIAMVMTHTQAAKVSVYWGQHGLKNEGSLYDLCKSGNYDIVNIAYLSTFGNGEKLMLHLSDHCGEHSKNKCTNLSEQIKQCQSRNVSVLLSIGGANSGDYKLNSKDDARDVAEVIWNHYLGGRPRSPRRPFGNAILNGVDFDIQKGGEGEGEEARWWAELAITLRKLSKEDPSYNLYLSAAAGCSYPDKHLDLAVRFVPFDHVSIKLYNDKSCDLSGDTHKLDSILKYWNEQLERTTTLFLGLSPPAQDVQSRFTELGIFVSSVLPKVLISDSRIGGFMLSSGYHDEYYSLVVIKCIINNAPSILASSSSSILSE